MTTSIGLSQAYTNDIHVKLNSLLASYQVFYMNTRGFHWNVKGNQFFQLHEKFEELYEELVEQIDEIAERILTLGQTPLHTYEDFIAQSTIVSAKNISSGNECVEHVVAGFKELLLKQREILAMAGDNDDEGTASQMSDYISLQEKHVWMYTAFLAQN